MNTTPSIRQQGRAAVAIAATMAISALSCAPAHTGAYKQKKREYALDPQTDKKNAAMSEGSLWQDGRPASMLFTDARALHANDLVVIKVEEIASANRSANTNLGRESSAAAKVDQVIDIARQHQHPLQCTMEET